MDKIKAILDKLLYREVQKVAQKFRVKANGPKTTMIGMYFNMGDRS